MRGQTAFLCSAMCRGAEGACLISERSPALGVPRDIIFSRLRAQLGLVPAAYIILSRRPRDGRLIMS